MENEKQSLGTKIKTGPAKLKSHWKTPPDGYQVCYKEFANFALGCGGTNIMGILTQYTGLVTSVHLMISYFKLSTGLAWVFSIAAAIITIIRSPILSMMIDNSNGKKGKFKPFFDLVSYRHCRKLYPYPLYTESLG